MVACGRAPKFTEGATSARHGFVKRLLVLVILSASVHKALPQRVQPKPVEAEKNRRAAIETRNLAFACENARDGHERDDREAARLYRLAADRGDAVSMGRLAQMYADGRGVEKSPSDASAWWRAAAKLGNAKAQYALALYHYSGRSDSKSGHLEKAFELMKLAAAQGFVKAQYNLALMYERGGDGGGGGVVGAPGATAKSSTDQAEAAKWYLAAADAGYPHAQYNLGVMTRQGRGVPQDDQEAGRWFALAAEQGHAHARHKLGSLEAHRAHRGGSAKEQSGGAVGAAAWGGVSTDGNRIPRWDDDDDNSRSSNSSNAGPAKKMKKKAATSSSRQRSRVSSPEEPLDSFGAEPGYSSDLRASSSLNPYKPPSTPISFPRPPWHQNHGEHFHLEATAPVREKERNSAGGTTSVHGAYEHQRGGLDLLKSAHPRRKNRKDHPISDMYV